MTLLDNFFRVNFDHPCPVCGHTDWCLVALDGTCAICPRVESPIIWSPGYVHDLNDTPPCAVVHEDYDSDRLSSSSVLQVYRSYRNQSNGYFYQTVAQSLGVTPEALKRMGAANAGPGVIAFPMYDGELEMSGIRYRRMSGEKYSLGGGREGIFLPELQGRNWMQPVYVTEGPTDAAAVISMGMLAIGRPNALGGIPAVLSAIRRLRAQQITIIADRDGVGQRGAIQLARALDGLEVSIISPAFHKDVRDYLRYFVTPSAASTSLGQQSSVYWNQVDYLSQGCTHVKH